MLVEYLGLVGLLGVGAGGAFFVYGLARLLRKQLARSSSASASSFELESESLDNPIGRWTSRYFFIAIVGLILHAGSFYFYLWGASIRQAGLMGLMVMLGFGMCLMMGVFYSWARGAVSDATDSADETRANSPDPDA